MSDVRLGWLVPSGFSLAVKEEVGCERGLKHALATGSMHSRSWLKTSQSTLRNYGRNY